MAKGGISISIFALLHLILIIFAVVVAVKCYPKHAIFAGVLAALFPEIALVYFAIRYFVLDDPGFCKSVKFRKIPR